MRGCTIRGFLFTMYIVSFVFQFLNLVNICFFAVQSLSQICVIFRLMLSRILYLFSARILVIIRKIFYSKQISIFSILLFIRNLSSNPRITCRSWLCILTFWKIGRRIIKTLQLWKSKSVNSMEVQRSFLNNMELGDIQSFFSWYDRCYGRLKLMKQFILRSTDT